jgi:hypothetical protein
MAFPDGAPLHRLPPSHPLLAGALPGAADLSAGADLRHFAANQLKGAGPPEEFVHGKGRVIFSSLDLTTGLLNTNTWGILGYAPGYAQSFLKDVILWTAAGAPEPSTQAAR